MKVVRREGGEYPDCIVKYFNFNKFNDDLSEKVFFWGWKCFEDSETKEKYKDYKDRIFLDTASPCAFLDNFDFVERARYFTKFYTICPLTAQLLNDNGVNAEAVCFPYPEWEMEPLNDVINPDMKKFDSIYYGQVHDPFYKPMIQTISKYNHQFLTISTHGLDQELANLVTQFNVCTLSKCATLALSKSCVGVNLLFCRQSQKQYTEYYLKNYKISDEVGSMLTSNIMPQMKTRMIESASCKTLMLLHRDKFNIIEEWFEPNKHFIYWDNYEQLEAILDDITRNYENYWDIVEEANKHVEQYSITNFWRKINE